MAVHGAVPGRCPAQFVYLAIAIVAEVVATSALKAADGFTAWQPSLLVVAGYVVSFYALSLALRTIPVGIAYAIWSGVGIVLISVIAGVAVINLFSTTVRA